MFSIEKFSKRISYNISKELGFDNDKEEVINYGIFACIQMCISIFLVGIIGAILGVFKEALLVSFITAILRKSSGGVHAGSPRSCNIIGTVASVLMGLIAKYINININGTILLGGIIFLISYIVIYRLAPVDSISKPIKTVSKRKRLKKSSLIIISLYFIIVILGISYCFISNKTELLSYVLCIYLGVLWQVFSLTKIGYFILKKLDGIIT